MQSSDAYDLFKARLRTGALKPGQFVTQRELASLVGVPLGAAREAIQRLAHESLLTVYPQRGIQIADVTVSALRDAYEYREILEIHAIRHFIAHAPLERINALEQLTLDILERAASGTDRALQDEAVEIDWQMHDEIIDSLGNEVVSRNYRLNAARIRLMRVNNRLIQERLVTALSEHLDVLRAAKSGDADAAVSSLRHHLAVARQRAIEGR